MIDTKTTDAKRIAWTVVFPVFVQPPEPERMAIGNSHEFRYQPHGTSNAIVQPARVGNATACFGDSRSRLSSLRDAA